MHIKHLRSGISHGNVSSSDLLQQVGTAGLSIFPNWDFLGHNPSKRVHCTTRIHRHANSRTDTDFVLLKNAFSQAKCLAVCAKRPTRTDHTYLTHQQEQKFAPDLCSHFHKPSMTGSECSAVRPYHVQLTPQISMTNQFRNFLYSKVVLINPFVDTQHLVELPYILRCYKIHD